MKISKKDVLHIANLAHISLEEKEVHQYRNDLEKILHSIEELREVETEHVKEFFNPLKEMAHLKTTSTETQNFEDKAKNSLSQELVLKNSPDAQYGQFKLKSIMEPESKP